MKPKIVPMPENQSGLVKYSIFSCNYPDFDTYEHDDCRITLASVTAKPGDAIAAVEQYQKDFGDPSTPYYAVVQTKNVHWLQDEDASPPDPGYFDDLDF